MFFQPVLPPENKRFSSFVFSPGCEIPHSVSLHRYSPYLCAHRPRIVLLIAHFRGFFETQIARNQAEKSEQISHFDSLRPRMAVRGLVCPRLTEDAGHDKRIARHNVAIGGGRLRGLCGRSFRHVSHAVDTLICVENKVLLTENSISAALSASSFIARE